MGKVAKKVCPICNKPVLGLWKHFWNEHEDSNLSNEEFLCKVLGLTEIPKCLNCGKPVKIWYSHYQFATTCSKKCSSVLGNKEVRRKLDSGELKLGNPEIFREYHRKQRLSDPEAYFNRMKRLSKLGSDKVKELFHSGKLIPGFELYRYTNPEKYYADKSRSSKIATNALKYKIETDSEFRGRFLNRFVYKNGMLPWSSDIELKFVQWLKDLNYNVIEFKIPWIKLIDRVTQLDALIKFNNQFIVIEIDGSWCHNIEKDIIRDKQLNELYNYKILRLDSNYCKELLSSYDNIKLFKLIENVELKEPYFNLLSIDEIMDWKLGKINLSGESI